MASDMTAYKTYEVSVPFRAGTDGYASYRIPALVIMDRGTVLAFAEGRVASSADWGDIDLVLRRSTDGGRTWGPLQVVSRNGDGTAGNPAPVVVDGGRIVLVQVHSAAGATEDRIRGGEVPPADGRRVWVQDSDDEGATWSTPREITEHVKCPEWRWYAATPGHALQLRHGAHAGRIVVLGNHSLPPSGADSGTEGKYNGGHDLLSDDGGATWRLGYVDDNPDGYVNVNETTAAQLPDGRVYLNTRTDAAAPGNRADAYSTDGGASLVKPFLRPQAGLVTPVVQGSVLHLDRPGARRRHAAVLRARGAGPPGPDDRAGQRQRGRHLAHGSHRGRPAGRLLRPRATGRGDHRTALRDG